MFKACTVVLLAATGALAADLEQMQLAEPLVGTVGGAKPKNWHATFHYEGDRSLVFTMMLSPHALTNEALSFTVTVKGSPITPPPLLYSNDNLATYVMSDQFAHGSAEFDFNITQLPSEQKEQEFYAVVYEAGRDEPTGEGGFVFIPPGFAGQELRGDMFVADGKDGSKLTSVGYEIQATRPLRVFMGSAINFTHPIDPTFTAGPHPSNLEDKELPFVIDSKTYVKVATTNMPRKTCEWLEQTDSPDWYMCKSGTRCQGQNCCSLNLGSTVANCPMDQEMCAQPDAPECNNDFCCAKDCATLGMLPRPCGTAFAIRTMGTVDTPAPTTAAPPAPPASKGSSKMSGGAVFLIIFFVGTAAYCLLGACFKWTNGARACPELMINHTFWMEVPVFVSEGIAFTKAKLCGGSSSSYSAYGGEYAPAPRETMGQSGASAGGLSQHAEVTDYGTANTINTNANANSSNL